MKSDLRIIKVADSDDVMVFHEEKEIAIISMKSLKELQEEDIEEVDSYRSF
jgi:hypothetical protein